MNSTVSYPSIAEALAARAALRRQYHEVTAAIFRLKKDEGVDDDTFDERRMELNGEARHLEDQIAIVDAWVDERKAARSEAEAREKASNHERQLRHELEALKLRETGDTERERLRARQAEIALQRDRLKADITIGTAHVTYAKRIAGCFVPGDDAATVENFRKLLNSLTGVGS